MTLLVSPKNVIDEVQSEGNLNQIGRVQRKMTMINNGHLKYDVRIVTRRDGPSRI